MLAIRPERDEAEILAGQYEDVIATAYLHRQYRVRVRHVRIPWWSFISPGTGVQGWGVYLTAAAGGLQEMACAVLKEIQFREQHAR